MRNKQGFAPVLIILIIVIAIGAILILGKNKLSSIIKLGTPAPAVTSDTANWKSFISFQSGYSLKYPSFWKQFSADGGCLNIEPSDNSINGYIIVCGPYPYQNNRLTNEDFSNVLEPGEKIVSKANLQIDNHEVIKETIIDPSGLPILKADIGNVLFNFDRNKPKQFSPGTLEVFFFERDNKNTDEAKKIFDQILSTFKFESPNGLLIYKSSKLENSSFSDFSISYSSDWIVKETKNSFYDKSTTLTKDGYSISIIQHTQGGNVCLFSDSPAFDGPSVDLKSVQYTELKTSSGIVFRRYLNNNSFYFCEGNNGTFESPTSIGIIIYTFPSSYDAKIITEMDNIIKTITINQ